jgi:hypothetical protein
MGYATLKSDCLSIEAQAFTRRGVNYARMLFSRRRDFAVPFSKRKTSGHPERSRGRNAARKAGEAGLSIPPCYL